MTATVVVLTILAWLGALAVAPFLFVLVCLRYLGSRSRKPTEDTYERRPD